MAIVLYLFLFAMRLSDIDLLHPSTQLDITFLREALEVPGGSLVAPLFDIKIPLYFFYLLAPVVLIFLHWFLLHSIVENELFAGNSLERMWTLVVIVLPTATIALIGWRFLPYGTMLPEREHLRGVQVFYWMLNATALVLDLALVAAMRTPLQLVVARVQFGSLVLLAAVSFGFVGWRLVLGDLSEQLIDWPSIAALGLAGLVAMGWTWSIAARWNSAGDARSGMRQGIPLIREWPTMLMTTVLALVGAIGITIASRPAARPLDLSGATLVRVKPSEIAIATIAAGAFHRSTLDPSSTSEVSEMGEMIARAKPAAIIGFGAGFNLTGYHLNRARFTGGQFDLIRLDNASLEDADFTLASLVGASFEHSLLLHARFVQADLTGAKLRPQFPQFKVASAGAGSGSGGSTPASNPSQDYTKALDFCRALFHELRDQGNPKNPKMPEPGQNEVRGISINLSESHLQNTDLTKADLRCATLESVLIQGGTTLKEADLRFANLRKITVEPGGANGGGFNEAKLQGADLSSATLSGIDLRNAQLERSLLIGANLKDAKFDGANLEGADFCGANLEGVNLTKAKFGSQCPNFKHAYLQKATFCVRQLSKCDLSDSLSRDMNVRKDDDGCAGGDTTMTVEGLSLAGTNQESSEWKVPSPGECPPQDGNNQQ